MADTGYDYTIHYKEFHDESDEHAEFMTKVLANELDPFLPPPGSGQVLDIGCGMGFAMLTLKKLGFSNVYGIDVDRGQIESCIRRGLSVERVDDTFEFLGEHKGRFMLVLLTDVLEHFPVNQQIQLLRCIFHALTPGGRLVVKVPNATSPLAARWRYIDFTHTSSFTEYSLRFVLLAAGFADVSVERARPLRRPSIRLWRKHNRAGLWRWLIRLWWRQVLRAELGAAIADRLAIELNIMAVAFHPPE